MSELENRYEPQFENRIDLQELQAKMQAVKQEVKKVIVGQDEVILPGSWQENRACRLLNVRH